VRWLILDRLDVVTHLRRMSESLEAFDRTNVRIVSAMHQIGPRNLLEVARQTKVPAATIYSRVRKLERSLMPLTYINPTYSKLGLMRIVVLASIAPGREALAEKLLLLPNLWSTTMPAEGLFNHYSVHAVPLSHISTFRRYIEKIRDSGIIQRCHLIKVSDSDIGFWNFEFFDIETKTWLLDWNRWLKDSNDPKKTRWIEDPTEYRVQADKKDLLILKELQKDGRKRFSEIAHVAGITLQAVKHRFDSTITNKGLIHNYVFRFIPYLVELSDLREVKLDFADEDSMNRFFSASLEFPFVMSISKALKKTSLICRTLVPRASSREFFDFLSKLARLGMVKEYSTIRLHLEGQRRQTISYEIYDDKRGWCWDSEKCLSDAENLLKRTCVTI